MRLFQRYREDRYRSLKYCLGKLREIDVSAYNAFDAYGFALDILEAEYKLAKDRRKNIRNKEKKRFINIAKAYYVAGKRRIGLLL